jgi:UDP:flavonoid glycosyltransferase YjiC (YdhE family)
MSSSSPPNIHLAYFVTPHGYGHAARASAIMASITEINPGVHFELFTQVPEWFFAASCPGVYTYHDCISDVGLAQNTPLTEDLDLTIRRLSALLPFRPDNVADLKKEILRTDCKLVVCDIAPLGIAVAKAAALPSVLTENFTWDWIYQGYVDVEPRFKEPIQYLHNIFSEADYHIQTEPVCKPSHRSHLTTHPIGRKARTPAGEIRRQLGISSAAKVVLISMGGIEGEYPFVQKLLDCPEIFFIIPGGGSSMKVEQNLVFLPHHSNFYHPDLMFASDMVVSKAGYSTISEAYWAGIPFAYVARQKFPESAVMAKFIQQSMGGFEISPEDFQQGNWVRLLTEWLAKPKIQRQPPNGADEAAQFICSLGFGVVGHHG